YQRFLGYMLLVRSDREFQAGRMDKAEEAARRAKQLYERAALANTAPEPLDPLFLTMAMHNLALALHDRDPKEAIKLHNKAYQDCAYFGHVTRSRDGLSFAYQILTEYQWFAGQQPDKVGFAITNLQIAIKGWSDLSTAGETPIDQKRKAVATL